MRWGILVALLVICAAARASAQNSATITTVEGKELRGRVVSEASDAVTIDSDGIEMKIPRAQIRSVVYGSAAPVTGPATGPATTSAATPAAAPATPVAPLEKTSFPVAGGTFGTPGGMNGVLGYYFDGWGVRASGMYLGAITGFQLDFLRNIGRSGTFSHNVHIALGTFHTEIPQQDPYYGGIYYDVNNWRYIAAGYDFNWNGFYISGGLSVGQGDYSNPQLLFQLGYVNEFR